MRGAGRLFVLHHVDPVHEELALLGLALYGLGSGHDGQPLLHILLGGIGLLAEEVQILLGGLNVAAQPEQQETARALHQQRQHYANELAQLITCLLYTSRCV